MRVTLKQATDILVSPWRASVQQQHGPFIKQWLDFLVKGTGITARPLWEL